MQSHHWLMLGLVAIVFYLIGAKFPAIASQVGVT